MQMQRLGYIANVFIVSTKANKTTLRVNGEACFNLAGRQLDGAATRQGIEE
jgi:hypothetical protein